jgi:uncharacterized protein YaaQ
MKLIIAVIRDVDNDPVSQGLVASGFRVTRIASTGGFFRRGSSTLMIGVSDEKLEEAVNTLRISLAPSSDAATRRATLFVLNVENFTQI